MEMDVDKRRVERVKVALLSMQRHSWEQGVAMQAFWEAGDREVAAAMAREAVCRAIEDGRTAVIGTVEAVTDPCATGEVLMRAAEWLDDGEMREANRRLLSWALERAPRNREGLVCHMMTGSQIWVDSMYMLPPYLAAAGYPEEACRQIRGFRQRLQDERSGLFSHMWDDERGEFIRRDFWGVGNGWAMAGMARVIDLLPERMSAEREELISLCTDLIGAVSGYIREDGLAHNVLDRPDSFVETNLPQMFAYTIYRGIMAGWLDEKWRERAELCRSACRKKVDNLGFVRGVCGEPHFVSPGIAAEGQAFYLMMEWAGGCCEERGKCS